MPELTLRLRGRNWYTFSSPDWDANYGGPKAKADVLEVLVTACGATALPLHDIPHCFSTLGRDPRDTIVVQYPTRGLTGPTRTGGTDRFEQFVAPWRGLNARKIVVVHDLKSTQISGLAAGAGDFSADQWADRETRLFHGATDMISHTAAMHNEIRRLYPSAPLRHAELRVFDYLCRPPQPADGVPARGTSIPIAFCGNLHGSSLYDELLTGLPRTDRLSYLLFTPEPGRLPPSPRPDVRLCAEEPAHTLPGTLVTLACVFGLCWWSEAVLSSGYLNVIAPHKASCYLAAGLPLIAPTDSYLARLVEAHGLGIALPDLSSLSDAVLSLPATALMDMKKRAAIVGRRVRRAWFTQTAFAHLLP